MVFVSRIFALAFLVSTAVALPKKPCKKSRKVKPRYSNGIEIFERPKNREENSDLYENLSESIAAQQTFI